MSVLFLAVPRVRRIPSVALVIGALTMCAASTRVEATDLDSSCVVSVLNRNVTVKEDGSWVLPNIPSGFGPVRARVTCTKDGITRSGHSELLNLGAFEIRDPVEITFDAPVAVPKALTVTAGATELGANQSTQILVTGAFKDNTTRNLTAAASGTTYRMSNSQIATVGADGQLTAVGSGVVFVTALNDGATGILRLRVVAAGDSDGDGIPDDVELANGLNPNDPIDALEDADRDGLTNLAELNLGTGLRNPDTDGDGLLDGREGQYGTNPLLFDTDGDGVSDGLEVASGSDPNDAGSTNLSLVLESVDVTPSAIAVVVNAIRVPRPTQLRVIGHLRDGSSLDLTSRARGTTYSTDNPLVASFGGADGEVFGGQTGSAVVTVGVPGFTSSVSVAVANFEPQISSTVRLGINSVPGGMAVDGRYLYVALGSPGLAVFDIQQIDAPVLVSTTSVPSGTSGGSTFTSDVKVRNLLAYVGTSKGLRVFDVSNPAAPTLLAESDPALAALSIQRLVLDADVALLSCGGAGLRVASLVNPRSPTLLADNPDTRQASLSATVAGAGVVNGTGLGISILARQGGTFVPVASTTDFTGAVASAGNIASVGGFGGLAVLDAAQPAITVLSSIDTTLAGFLTDVASIQDHTIGTGFISDGVVRRIASVIDLSDPRNARVVARPGASTDTSFGGRRVAADESRFFVAADTDNGPTLYLGKYLQVEDTLGVPPTVQLVSPVSGTVLPVGWLTTFLADANDDVEVAKVTLLIDGIPIETRTSRPFSIRYRPTEPGTLRVEFEAEDFGGNRSRSVPVDLVVAVDQLPTLTFTAPTVNDFIQEGVPISVALSATDNEGLTRIELSADAESTTTFDLTASPLLHSSNVTTMLSAIPIDSNRLYQNFYARVFDSLGQATYAYLHVPIRTANGGAAPQVTLVEPDDTTVFYSGRVVRIRATASDDGGVQTIRAYLNGQLVGRTTSGNEILVLPTAGSIGAATVRVEAEDAAGQVTAIERTVAVQEDPAPVLNLLTDSVDPNGVRTFAAAFVDNEPLQSVTFDFGDGPVAAQVSEPFAYAQYLVLPDVPSITVTVSATDSVGHVVTISRVVTVSPVVEIENHAEVVQGEASTYRAIVRGPVSNVSFLFNGELVSPVADGSFFTATYAVLDASTELTLEVQVTDDGARTYTASAAFPVVEGTGRYTPESVNFGEVTRPYLANRIAGFGTPGIGNPNESSVTSPTWLALNPGTNEIHFVEPAFHRVRRLSFGNVLPVVGSGVAGFAGDGGDVADVAFDSPQGIAFSPAGDLYVADSGNGRIRRIAFDGTVSTVAGSGVVGDAGAVDLRDPSTVGLNHPASIAIAPDGLGGDVVYISDTLSHRIWELRSGVMSVLAGAGAAAGDFGGDTTDLRTAHIGEPVGLTLSGGKLLATDRLNGAVFEIDLAQGLLRTVMGTGQPGPTAENVPARSATLNAPAAVLRLENGDEAVVADFANARVRIVKADDRVVTVAGQGPDTPDVVLSPLSEPVTPFGMIYLPSSNYYGNSGTIVVSEPTEHRIRTFRVESQRQFFSIGGPPDREVLSVEFESPVSWISATSGTTLRDVVVVVYPGLAAEEDFEIPLTVRLRVRNTSQCGGVGCPEQTVVETIVIRVSPRRPD